MIVELYSGTSWLFVLHPPPLTMQFHQHLSITSTQDFQDINLISLYNSFSEVICKASASSKGRKKYAIHLMKIENCNYRPSNNFDNFSKTAC